jgi:hypothetical protein
MLSIYFLNSNHSYKTFLEIIFPNLFIGVSINLYTNVHHSSKIRKTINLLSKGHKCLYFSLEFNKRQLKKNFAQRLKSGVVTEESIKNIEVIVSDTLEHGSIKNIAIGELYTMLEIMKHEIQKGGLLEQP